MVTASFYSHPQATIAAVKIGRKATLSGSVSTLWAQSHGCLGWILYNIQGRE
jgi:hypothetical protein